MPIINPLINNLYKSSAVRLGVSAANNRSFGEWYPPVIDRLRNIPGLKGLSIDEVIKKLNTKSLAANVKRIVSTETGLKDSSLIGLKFDMYKKIVAQIEKLSNNSVELEQSVPLLITYLKYFEETPEKILWNPNVYASVNYSTGLPRPTLSPYLIKDCLNAWHVNSAQTVFTAVVIKEATHLHIYETKPPDAKQLDNEQMNRLFQDFIRRNNEVILEYTNKNLPIPHQVYSELLTSAKKLVKAQMEGEAEGYINAFKFLFRQKFNPDFFEGVTMNSPDLRDFIDSIKFHYMHTVSKTDGTINKKRLLKSLTWYFGNTQGSMAVNKMAIREIVIGEEVPSGRVSSIPIDASRKKYEASCSLDQLFPFLDEGSLT